MSQPHKGKKSSSSKPAGKGSRAHGDKKSGASSKPGDKKGSEVTEMPASTSASQPPKTHASGAASTSKTQPPSTVATKASDMKSTETKATSSHSQTSGQQSHSRKRHKVQSSQTAKTEPGKVAQSLKPDDSQTKHQSEEKQKEPGGAKSPSKPSVAKSSKKTSPGKAATSQTEKSTQVSSIEEPKPKTENKSLASGAAGAAAATVGAVTAAGLVARADKPSTEAKENKSAAPSSAVEAAPTKPPEKSDIDKALDDLIDTLGGPEEHVPPSPVYTGPEITDSCSFAYIEELGKREGSIPPGYRKLLEGKGDDQAVPPEKTEPLPQKPVTEDDIADALSSDFTCSTFTPGEEKITLKEKPTAEGEIVQAQSTSSVRSSAPPKEKKPKLEEAAISDDALDALADTLGAPEPEHKEDVSSLVEVSEAKVEEKKINKAGERDDTIPPEYRLKPAMDKDGKPLVPKPEEKPKPVSESDLIDEFSKDFVCPVPPAADSKPSKPTDTSKKPAVTAPAKASAEEVVSSAAVSTVQSSAPSTTTSAGHASDEAVEALCGSLGKREPDPEENKSTVDKVKEKAKQEEREKLGEDEETIPPEYRLIEAKNKDGKPLLPKSKEETQSMSESDLLDALSKEFSSSPATLPSAPLATPNKSTAVKSSPAASEEIVSSTTASAVHSAAPPAATPGGKEQDNALDLLAGSLGQREPDPDENKPVVDKVKEGAKSEHRDKLGDRDDTIPPDYRHLLDSDEQGKPVKPIAKEDVKPKEPKKPTDDSAAIDALSGDFDNCAKTPPTPQHSKVSGLEDKSGKEAATTKPATKDDGKPENPKTAKEQSFSSKPKNQKTS
ncbi:calpastatin isoform X2 [Chelonoidis abingdonii]|uniref:calpastatin isoform X2 n=1 Tax=Chelonoidis abingdonii TaxID=106734 RepID=UPI0013F22EDA|nr:calpastatin isoform X2 [Chelonoidis abingdonii]